MKRVASKARPDWESRLQEDGMHFHTFEDDNGDPLPYWDESAYYDFSSRQIDEIEAATYAVNDMVLEATGRVVDSDELLTRFHIPQEFWSLIRSSWKQEDITIYGRMDFAYDGRSAPKLLEYNAQTPTGLLEASVIQWRWMKDLKLDAIDHDQFNTLDERLQEVFGKIREQFGHTFYFSAFEECLEDYTTVKYLEDCAVRAGLKTKYIHIQDIGWSETQNFTDLEEHEIRGIFCLNPWEFAMREQFARNLLKNTCRWFEAPWKVIPSSKAILPVLSEMYPTHENLLHAAWKPFGKTYVEKPIYSREGSNVRIVRDGRTVEETDGNYGAIPLIYQEYYELPEFDGNHPIIGSWMVNGYAAGIGIREDRSKITGNTSRFVPHVFRR